MKFKNLVVGMEVVVKSDAYHNDKFPNNPPVGTVLTVTSIDRDGSIDFRVEWNGDDDYIMNTTEVAIVTR